MGEWYGPTWEAVEWKVERLQDSDTYFITRFEKEGKNTFFTASVVKVRDLMLLDLKEAPAEERPPGAHLLMKLERCTQFTFVTRPISAKLANKSAAFGGEPLLRCKKLILRPMRKGYFDEHPGRMATELGFDDKGKPTGLVLVGTPKELREFFLAHGRDKGLWAKDENSFVLENKLNPGDLER